MDGQLIYINGNFLAECLSEVFYNDIHDKCFMNCVKLGSLPYSYIFVP